MAKRLLLLVITLVIILVGGYYFFGMDDKKSERAQTNTSDFLNPQAQKLYQALQTANYIEQGQQNAEHSMYVIFDPNCIFCHALFAATQALVKEGTLAIRWIPIGIIKRSSPLKVMAILSAKSPIDGLLQNEKSFNYAQEEGGIAPVTHPDDKLIDQFNHNMILLKGLISFVPVLVYKNVQGQPQISGGSLLPLKADDLALKENEQKVVEFVKNVGKSWDKTPSAEK